MSAREIIARALVDWSGSGQGADDMLAEIANGQADAILAALTAGGYRILARGEIALGVGWKFQIGERVTKIKGSSWTGRVVGFYSTTLTPIGYNVESENETGSVQLYPEAALRSLPVENGGGG